MTQPEDTIQLLADAVRRFVREKLVPAEPQVEEEDRIPEALIAQLKELGLFGMTIPEAYGGLVYNDKQWRAFLAAIGEPERFDNDRRFSTHGARAKNIGEVYGYLAGVLVTRTTEQWLELFARADVPAARMQSVDDVLADSHLAATGFVAEFEHPTEGRMRGIGVASEWTGSPPVLSRHAPRLGEQTREILREAGYCEAQIAELLASGSAAEA